MLIQLTLLSGQPLIINALSINSVETATNFWNEPTGSHVFSDGMMWEVFETTDSIAACMQQAVEMAMAANDALGDSMPNQSDQ